MIIVRIKILFVFLFLGPVTCIAQNAGLFSESISTELRVNVTRRVEGEKLKIWLNAKIIIIVDNKEMEDERN